MNIYDQSNIFLALSHCSVLLQQISISRKIEEIGTVTVKYVE